jgi:hypothetical protein
VSAARALTTRRPKSAPIALKYPDVKATDMLVRWTYFGRGRAPFVAHRNSEYEGWVVPMMSDRLLPFAGFSVIYDNVRGAHSWFDFTPEQARLFPENIRRSIFHHAALAAARNGAPGLTGEVIERWFMEPNRLLDGTLALESRGGDL